MSEIVDDIIDVCNGCEIRDIRISELKGVLHSFQGMTFSENQRIAELEAQNSKMVEALKLANDILGKNSIYYGDLAEFYKLLIELEIR